jgi:glycosyltransferase involved in cell wall biosynthesis
LYFGRIHTHKGVFEAIRIAQKSRMKLVICGRIQEQEYFNEKVAPWLNEDTVIYKGNVGPTERNQLLGDAFAILHPISFEEPFGLIVAEAMTCGTPVIAFDRGSMKELIVDGKTGFLVNDIAAATEAVTKINTISRSDCRDHALEKFSSHVMVMHYLKLYREILKDDKRSGEW